MSGQGVRSRSEKRSHIVVVPGFAGFDALGRLRYYAGLTTVFQPYRSGKEVLHYFDNFPAAAVITRATRLRDYLAKRIARGEIFDGDEVMLVGHSTGGLDIRRLLCDLSDLVKRKQSVLLEGREKVDPHHILQFVRRVVFLSVPHWGTNIADWIQAQWIWREALIKYLRAVVEGSQVPLVEPIESAIAASTASLTGAELFRAVQDALDEANASNGKPGPIRTAEAHEAASELALYLRHMASDFRAIHDLTSCAPRMRKRETISPAHFNVEDREKEREQLKNIEFLSYVTVGRRPFPFDPNGSVPPWELASPWTYPTLCKDGGLGDRGTDILYRACYRACAGGPFEPPKNSLDQARRLSPRDPIAVWDNDGIVNTLSMFWPLGRTVVVHADHMDIVGHYKRLLATPGGGRKYQTYDLLRSGSGFGDKMFQQIWNEIFSFCVGHPQVKQTFAATMGH